MVEILHDLVSQKRSNYGSTHIWKFQKSGSPIETPKTKAFIKRTPTKRTTSLWNPPYSVIQDLCNQKQCTSLILGLETLSRNLPTSGRFAILWEFLYLWGGSYFGVIV